MPEYDDPPTHDELPSLARDVTYELRMAHLAATRLRELESPMGKEYDWSAWVEVLLLHGRVLTDFFGNVPTRDDLSASHYDSNWSRDAPDVHWLQDHVPAINKRVMHLTAYRHRRRAHPDAPDIEELIVKLTGVMVDFLSGLTADRRGWFPIVIDASESGRD